MVNNAVKIYEGKNIIFPVSINQSFAWKRGNNASRVDLMLYFNISSRIDTKKLSQSEYLSLHGTNDAISRS